jgi:hypothetical protein
MPQTWHALHGVAASVKIASAPAGVSDKWDAADALAEGWDQEGGGADRRGSPRGGHGLQPFLTIEHPGGMSDRKPVEARDEAGPARLPSPFEQLVAATERRLI